MIFSDRVSGKVSVFGLVMAGCLALVSLPGWSLDEPSGADKAPRPGGAGAQPASREGQQASTKDADAAGPKRNELDLLLRALLPASCASAVKDAAALD